MLQSRADMSIWDRDQKDLVAGWTAIEDDQRPRLCAEQTNELEEKEKKGWRKQGEKTCRRELSIIKR